MTRREGSATGKSRFKRWIRRERQSSCGRETHLDQLTDKLKEDRLWRVIEPILTATYGLGMHNHDLEYARDLGLVVADSPIRIANLIHAEVIPRALTWAIQEKLT
ncbi:MAG: hypothetical protein OXE78_14265, partial [Gammaproteobacteria bacterium]|nr:hypothetical protein [Gammaproteobacteria bacterium]